MERSRLESLGRFTWRWPFSISKVIRSSFTEGHYTVIHGPKAGVYIHPGAPYPGFKAGEPVVVERVILPHEGSVSGGSGVPIRA